MSLMKKCNAPGCPELVAKGEGKCGRHRREAEARRGSPSARGYGHRHRTVFREGVLAKHPICVLCHRRPATEADHYPMSRSELIDAGLDPDDPRYGRGLCKPCHSRWTQVSGQGGWKHDR